jgi:hypothetical protein
MKHYRAVGGLPSGRPGFCGLGTYHLDDLFGFECLFSHWRPPFIVFPV